MGSEIRVTAKGSLAVYRLAAKAATTVVRIVAVGDDAQIHFAIRPGIVRMNRHLLRHGVA